MAIFPLRPYQSKIGKAILKSIGHNSGLTFSVEIARQGGKNELSAQIETCLLASFMHHNVNLIKCSPTFNPQALISIRRLEGILNETPLADDWGTEMGHILRLGQARAIFLSADLSSNVVGNTTHLLLEVDEAQDVDERKYTKEFKPMGSTTNVTNVLYGTTWDENTLLERVKQDNLELQKKDGIQRHFRYDWQEVAKYNPRYRSYVEAERDRLGENHPLFLTQYRLLPIHGGGGFLNSSQKAQLQGSHLRLRFPQPGRIYVAGIDLGGEAENDEQAFLKDLKPRCDSTVLTIGEVDFTGCAEMLTSPSIRIVEHYAWVGQKHADLYPRLVDLLKNVWRCRRIVVDSTGIGQPVSSFLKQALGSRVISFTFTAPSKSELGFNLLAFINSGDLKIYKADNSPDFQEFWFEMEKAKSHYRPSRTLNFFVNPYEGHDDYLMSLALLVEAVRGYSPREAKGS
jgi:hypothetical protein